MYLLLDVETTGLPNRNGLSFGTVPPYDDLERYSEARIVQFTAMLCDHNLDTIELVDHIVKCDGFSITNADIHGITEEISQEQGKPFADIAEIFQDLLPKCTHIIAHNIDFDIPVIKSELHRLSLSDILEALDSKQFFCTMKHTKQLVNIKTKYGLKYPSLSELYEYVFKAQMENAHNSMYDVINLHKIVKKLNDDGILILCYIL